MVSFHMPSLEHLSASLLTLQMHLPFNTKKYANHEVFLSFSEAQDVSVCPFRPIYILELVKSPPFHIP